MAHSLSADAVAEADRILAAKDNPFAVLRIAIAEARPFRTAESASTATPPVATVAAIEQLSGAIVRRCFRQLAVMLHPDKLVAVSDGDGRRLERCNAAFKVLVHSRDSLETPVQRATAFAKHFVWTPPIPGADDRNPTTSHAPRPSAATVKTSTFATWAHAAESVRTKARRRANTQPSEVNAAPPGHRCGLWSSPTYAPPQTAAERFATSANAMSGGRFTQASSEARPSERDLAKKASADPVHRLHMVSCGDKDALRSLLAESRRGGDSTTAVRDSREKPINPSDDRASSVQRHRTRWSSACDDESDALPRTRSRF